MFQTKFSFPGGIKPRDNKNRTLGSPIETLPTPKEVIVHFHQLTPSGTLATPLIKPKDKVKKGEKIGESSGKISSPVHSPISGVVKAITELCHPALGKRSLACVIEWDGEEGDFLPLSFSEPLEAIKEAGIIGLGGAGFPTAIKLNPLQPVETLIINGCECEPYLTGDARTMIEHPNEVLEGARIMAEILKAGSILIALEENNKLAIKRLREVIGEREKVIVMKTKYPGGSEKQLVLAILKREIPKGKLPYEIGVSVQNVQTSFAVYEAVKKRKPLFERVLTVSGDGVAKPKNLRVPIGTKIRDIIEYCGGYKGEVGKIVLGGPLMGLAIPDDSYPILKNVTGVLVFSREREDGSRECIRCGRCVSVCPMGLLPTNLYHHIRKSDWTNAQKEGVLDCIECGSCAYSCPAKISLVENFKMAKVKISTN